MKLDAVPSIEVSVRCGGTSLSEYEEEADNRDDDLVGVRYIEATSGSNFSLFFKATSSEHSKWPHVVCEIKLDGKLIYAPILDVAHPQWYGTDFQGAYGIENGQPVLRRFKFADLPTNDGHADRAKLADFKNLGEIQLNLLACRKSTPGEGNSMLAAPSSNSIPEKALKGRAISNRAALDKAEPATRSHTWNVEYEDKKRRPFATYVFKYRSRRDLQIEGLLPRSPSPPAPIPLEERDPDDLTLEEARELLRRKRAQESEKEVKVKKEKRGRDEAEDDEDAEVTITEERNSKRARLSTDSGVEIVDLTED